MGQLSRKWFFFGLADLFSFNHIFFKRGNIFCQNIDAALESKTSLDLFLKMRKFIDKFDGPVWEILLENSLDFIHYPFLLLNIALFMELKLFTFDTFLQLQKKVP